MGKHLKLGTYSFIISVALLGLTPGVAKAFTREELPEDLKPLYDIVHNEKACEKSIFVNIIDVVNDLENSGYLAQASKIQYYLGSVDGDILNVSLSDDNVHISIRYNVY